MMTRKKSDNFRLWLYARIFSAFRVILRAANRNAGLLAPEPVSNTAVGF